MDRHGVHSDPSKSVFQLAWAPTLSYERVRQTIVILTRMTGYEDEDIFSYLENQLRISLLGLGVFCPDRGKTVRTYASTG